jgi:hypothetical protein
METKDYVYDIETDGLRYNTYDYAHIMVILFNSGNVDLNRFPIATSIKYSNTKPIPNDGNMKYTNSSECESILECLRTLHPNSYIYTDGHNVYWANHHTVSDKHTFWTYNFEEHFRLKDNYTGWKTGLAYGV